MSKKYKIAVSVLISLGAIVAGGILLLRGNTIAVLNPKGSIAQEQFDLIILTSLLSLIIIVPVFGLTFYIAWKYRVGNKKAAYRPDWDRSRLAESIWWLIPSALILVLAAITWKTTHDLDPYKPIASTTEPITIQVVALEWKWLFIYPQQDIATVNYIQFPEDTPINFELTADAPMNSFWIPQLGGQVYTMAGMQTKLHLMADEPGDFRGSSANLSGEGFAGMKFTASSTTKETFDQWVQSVKKSSNKLTLDAYYNLARPSKNNKTTEYATRDENLYDTVMMKYMMPEGQGIIRDEHHSMHHDNGDGH